MNIYIYIYIYISEKSRKCFITSNRPGKPKDFNLGHTCPDQRKLGPISILVFVVACIYVECSQLNRTY